VTVELFQDLEVDRMSGTDDTPPGRKGTDALQFVLARHC
jgi:hypothetical protein